MAKIIAKGKKNGKAITVECDCDDYGASMLFNGAKNTNYEAEVIMAALSGVAIGGTYYPETLPLQIVAALENSFFDRRPSSLDVDGEIEQIPGEEGVVY